MGIKIGHEKFVIKIFEECDLIEIEGSVFSEWLDKLRDNSQAVAVDLKPGVVGYNCFSTKVSNELSFKSNPNRFLFKKSIGILCFSF